MSEQRDTHEFLEKKADHAFQIECAAQTRLSEAKSELDRREWRMQNADVALDETNMQIQSQSIERYQAKHSTDQNRREKSSLCDRITNEKQLFRNFVLQINKFSRNTRITKKNLLCRSRKSSTIEE